MPTMYHQAWLPKATFRLSLDDDALYHPFLDFFDSSSKSWVLEKNPLHPLDLFEKEMLC